MLNPDLDSNFVHRRASETDVVPASLGLSDEVQSAPIHQKRFVRKEENDQIVYEPISAGKIAHVVNHTHGIGGTHINDEQDMLAGSIASGVFMPPATVMMPLADKIIRNPLLANVMSLYNLARFAMDLPKDLQLKLFENENDPTLLGHVVKTLQIVWSPPMWHPFAFKAAEIPAADNPDIMKHINGLQAQIMQTLFPAENNQQEKISRNVGSTYAHLIGCWNAVQSQVTHSLFPKLVPDLSGTAPYMQAAAIEVKKHAREILLSYQADKQKYDPAFRVYASAFSQGVSPAACSALALPHEDPSLAPRCLIAVGAPIIIGHGMPEVIHRMPIYNILPRGDPITRVLDYGAEEVRRDAAKANIPIRVWEPDGNHGLCEPSARLVIAILKREMSRSRPQFV